MLFKDDFTQKELDVLELLVHGLSNKEISAELNVSVSTVKTHVESILFKFGVHRRGSAAIEAILYRIIEYKKNPSF